MRPRSTHIMARSLVCRQRRAETSQASAQGCSGAVAGPAGIPSVARVPYSTNIVCGSKERTERGWVRSDNSCVTRAINKSR